MRYGWRGLRLALLVGLLLMPSAHARGSQGPSEPPRLPWLIVHQPTEVYGGAGELLWLAQPGEQYQVLALEGNWALAHRVQEGPDRPVWIATDPRVALVVPWVPPPTPPARAALTAAGSTRWNGALATQQATRARLRVLGDAPSCAEARLVAFRRSEAEPGLVDHWYVSSQLWADAALLRLAAQVTHDGAPGGPSASLLERAVESETPCQVEKGFAFLDRLWDYEAGGYYARANPTGTVVERGPRYADDNSLVGLALLAAAEVAREEALTRRYTFAARRAADFLTQGGLWDETFGGGFWWHTGRGDTPEGKPAQTNALAALFFGRLFQATGEEACRAWALRILAWMDAEPYDPSVQLYRWSLAYEQPSQRQGVVRSDRYFNYDQAIAMEAQLLAYRLDGDPARLERARSLGAATHIHFWGQERGGYNLQAGAEQVYASYAAWTSLGHLALYDQDQDPRWLALAQQNADALAATLQEPDGGYGYRHYRCVDRLAPGCEGGPGTWVLDRTRDTSAQAWLQHLQIALGERLVRPPA